MSNSMKTIVFIISLIAYFIYSIISSFFIGALVQTVSMSYAIVFVYISSAIGILVMLFAQAGVKHYYTGRFLKTSKIHIKVPLGKFRFVDRLATYLLPALGVIYPIAQTRSLSSVTLSSIIFFFAVVVLIEIVFYIVSNTMHGYITNKGIFIRGLDLRLELPLPSNYHNPSGFFPFERIINFMDLNDRLLIEQSYDLGTITLKGDSETLKQIKAVLLANKVMQKKF
ncbi:MAG: hypothetical protein K0R84_1173 [Clostridia bacterium]|nr:hypothetical protein [Clostridia bacterium]